MIGAGNDRRQIQVVAVRVQDVHIAIFVEIDKLNARRTKRRRCRFEKHALLKSTLSIIEECRDFLMLLGEQCNEIQMTVAIEIDRQDVDRSRLFHNAMILVCPVGPVFQPANLALFDKAVRGDHEINVTVAIKIARLDIRHPANVVEDCYRGKLHRAIIGQQNNTSHQIVGRLQSAEAPDDDVLTAIALACQDLRMRGIADQCKCVFSPGSVPIVNPGNR